KAEKNARKARKQHAQRPTGPAQPPRAAGDWLGKPRAIPPRRNPAFSARGREARSQDRSDTAKHRGFQRRRLSATSSVDGAQPQRLWWTSVTTPETLIGCKGLGLWLTHGPDLASQLSCANIRAGVPRRAARSTLA